MADDMGLGKTVQVIGLISALLKRTQYAEHDLAACRRQDARQSLCTVRITLSYPDSLLANSPGLVGSMVTEAPIGCCYCCVSFV